MEHSAALAEKHSSHTSLPPEGDGAKAVIMSELEKILESPPFRGSSRRKEFLSYVVRHVLDGHYEMLKERTIGIEVFHRSADYATGEDPVVRVQAGEVRRRLEQYYYSAPDVRVRIEIPIGSYHPEFHWTIRTTSPVTVRLENPVTSGISKPKIALKRSWIFVSAAVVFSAIGVLVSQHKAPSLLEHFWSPVFNTSQPVMICLAKPVVYRPSDELYQRYARTHGGTFETEAERENKVLPLDPNEKLVWGDMRVYDEYGIATGDAYAAVQISNLMLRMGKPTQLRIGKNYSFEDLRNSPAVVLGAFNNQWTAPMTANLHFSLIYGVGIREQGPSGRQWTWQFDSQGNRTADYGVISRLLDSKTGQFLVSAAGIGATGTQAAGEVVSNPKYLKEALQGSPPDWDKKNIQWVIQTNVIDSVPGPPHIVASYYW